MKSRPYRRMIIFITLGLIAVVIGFIILSGSFSLGKKPDDFIAYWSAGRLLIIGEDPYSPENTMILTKQLGFGESGLLLSFFYPPWTFPIFLPFSTLAYSTSRLLWFFISIIIYISCALWIWNIYRGPANKIWIFALSILLISPAMFALHEGQVTPLILLGIVGFLYFEQRQKWFLAGSFLTLTTFKPQALYLFWVALLFWILFTREWKIIAGLAITIVLSTLTILFIDQNIILDYIRMNVTNLPINCINPTLSSVLCLLTNNWQSWYLLIGPILGFAWFIFYWLRKKDDWRWIDTLPMVIFVSIITAPYAWMHDGMLFIFAVLEVFILFLNQKMSKKGYLLFLLFILSNLIVYTLIGYFRINQVVFIWIPFIYLFLYLISKYSSPKEITSIQDHRPTLTKSN